ncbi:beta strand repeat-containing protein, partial [Giesbergeria sinuosa]
ISGGETTAGNTFTVNNLNAGALANTKLELTDETDHITLTGKSFLAGGVSDTATIELNNNSGVVGTGVDADGIDVGTLTFVNVDVLNLKSTSDGTAAATEQNSIATLVATDLEKLVITGDNAIAITTDATTTGLTEVDASGLVNSSSDIGATVNLSADVTGGGALLIGSAQNDSLTGTGNGTTSGDTFRAGKGSDTIVVDAGATAQRDVFVYTATALGTGDLSAGDVDTIYGVQGVGASLGATSDVITLDTAVLNALKVTGTVLGSAGANVAIGSTLSATTNIAAVTNGADLELRFDLNGNGAYDTSSDFAIKLMGHATNSVTYDAATKLLYVSSFATGATLGNDTLVGDASANRIDGLAGNDTISAAAGNDTLIGSAGNDSMTGGADADTFDITTTAADTDEITDWGVGADVLSGTAFAGQTLKVTIDNASTLAFDASTAFATNGMVSVTGGNANDTITGGANSDTLSGGAGTDSLVGGAGTDSLVGGAGNDTITGGTGNDTMTGGADNDTFIITTTAADTDEITDWGVGTDVLSGTAFAGQTLKVTIDNASTLAFDASTAFATNGTVSVTGGNANDTITGGANSDTLSGGAGTDSLVGGAGVDVITGGAGADTVTGGTGNDIFVYETVADWSVTETITDYGTAAQNTTALDNAPIAGLNGDVLRFDYSNIAAITGFVGVAGNLVTTIPLTTNGSTLLAGALVQGAGAQVATAAFAQFLYNSTTGLLSIDVDGTAGATAVVDIALIGTGLTLTGTDILFVA